MRWVLMVCLLMTVGTAHADNRAAAKAAYIEGKRYYDIGEFTWALRSFKRAYLSYEEPSFLFNIAQCHRQLGEKREALTTYRSYLRNLPNAANADEVQKLIAQLEAAIADDQRTKETPPHDTQPPGEPEARPPESKPPEPVAIAPSPAPTVEAPVAATPAPLIATPAPAEHRPRRRWVVVGVVVGAVVVVGVALGVGLGLGLSSSATGKSAFSQTATLPEIRF